MLYNNNNSGKLLLTSSTQPTPGTEVVSWSSSASSVILIKPVFWRTTFEDLAYLCRQWFLEHIFRHLDFRCQRESTLERDTTMLAGSSYYTFVVKDVHESNDSRRTNCTLPIRPNSQGLEVDARGITCALWPGIVKFITYICTRAKTPSLLGYPVIIE